jgi:uncharacterized protein
MLDRLDLPYRLPAVCKTAMEGPQPLTFNLDVSRNWLALLMFCLSLGFFMCCTQTVRGEEWSPTVFDYDPPDRLDLHEAPTRKPYNLSGTRQEELVFKDVRGKDVPVLMTMPQNREGPFPLVVLVHGFTSNKEEVSHQLARVLTQRGFACLAIDMPAHGERPGLPRDMFGPDRKGAYDNVIEAVMDVRQAIDLAETRKEFDTSSGVYLVGYSMGSWIGTLAGAADRRVKAMVLMVAGSATTASKEVKDEGPGLKDRLELVHHYAVLRHNAALPKFAPRPVLMMNGKRDVLVPADRAKTLFESAGEPKEMRWYDSGHLLPPEAYRDAADWLAKQIKHAN